MNMEITRTKNDGIEEMTLTGRLDTVTSTKLQAALMEAIEAADRIALDFAAIDYVSSAGLRVLLQGQKAAQKLGKALIIQNVSSEVMEVFEVTGFSGILTII